jgi:16S rRNA (adenine1518-N6/adenine1519-N6)-dimethyltransferase
MNLRAKKKWGQNFLIDRAIQNAIVEEANINDNTLVIEIGPGQGAITSLLVEVSNALLAYEIDPDLAKILSGRYQGIPNVKVIQGDFLTQDVEKDIKSFAQTFSEVKVVANLPYYITTPIITKLMLELSSIDELIIMVQYEVAKRLTAQVKDSDYSALSVITQYYSMPQFLFKVPPTAFKPQPKVDSAVIRLTKNHARLVSKENEQFWIEFIRHAFQQPRKTLVNNLSKGYDKDKESISKILVDLKLSSTVRADSLSIEELTKIFDIYYHKMIRN